MVGDEKKVWHQNTKFGVMAGDAVNTFFSDACMLYLYSHK